MEVYLPSEMGFVDINGVVNLHSYTAERSYRDDLWAQADVDLGDLWNSRLDTSRRIGFLDRLVALPDENGNDSEAEVLSTEGDADPTLVKIITQGLPGANQLLVGEGDPATENLAANKVEMLKEYVQQLNSLNGAYYTQSYDSVDGTGNPVLSAVAIGRVNELVAGVEKLENSVYLTAKNWNEYVGAVDPNDLLGLIDADFKDDNVKRLMEGAFSQAQRTDTRSSRSLRSMIFSRRIRVQL